MNLLRKIFRTIAVKTGIIRKPILAVEFSEGHPSPDTLQKGIIYIIRSGGYQKWAIFRCPGHEDEIIQLCLMGNRHPQWKVKTDVIGRPTIHPSVRQTAGSYAHFWVKKGQVEWCSDSGQSPQISSFR